MNGLKDEWKDEWIKELMESRLSCHLVLPRHP